MNYLSIKGGETDKNVTEVANNISETCICFPRLIKNEVYLALAGGGATAVLLQRSAVFDTIHHGTLIDSLISWFGVGSVILDWFKFYPSDRSQYIKIVSNYM